MAMAVNGSQGVIASVCQTLLETAPASNTLWDRIKRAVSGVFARLRSPAPDSARYLQLKLTTYLESGHATQDVKAQVAQEFFDALAMRVNAVYPEGAVPIAAPQDAEEEAQSMPLNWRVMNAISRTLLMTQGPQTDSYRKELFDRVDATFCRPLSEKVLTLGFLALNSMAMFALSRGWSSWLFPYTEAMNDNDPSLHKTLIDGEKCGIQQDCTIAPTCPVENGFLKTRMATAVDMGLIVSQILSSVQLQSNADFLPVRMFHWINSGIAALSELQLARYVMTGARPFASLGLREVSMLSSLVQRFSPISALTTPLTALGMQGWMVYSVYRHFFPQPAPTSSSSP